MRTGQKSECLVQPCQGGSLRAQRSNLHVSSRSSPRGHFALSGSIAVAARCLLLLIMVSIPRFAGAETDLASRWNKLWWTPSQQGQRAFEQGDYTAAAQKYKDPMRVGTAWYRAGEFEKAAAAFGRVNSA